jgi:hypothetical protein
MSQNICEGPIIRDRVVVAITETLRPHVLTNISKLTIMSSDKVRSMSKEIIVVSLLKTSHLFISSEACQKK